MFPHLRGIAAVPVMIFASLIIGCSGSGNAIAPENKDVGIAQEPALSSHSPWGLWQFACNPAAGTVEYVEMRDAQLHLNALKFLEPPANLYLTLESPPHYTGNVLTIDIGLRHPFLGMNTYTGFDACGILIADASYHPSEKPGLLIGGEGDTRITNADGYSRWWNPTEFPYNAAQPISGYIDGLLGVPDSVADFSGILNSYKYFCDELDDPDDPMSDIDPESRGVFSAGQKNVRTYRIELDNSYIFNYAIDACWAQPVDPNPPIEVPDDFGENANRPEAWNISVHEIDNSLFYDVDEQEGGGSAQLSIDVYDWFNAEMNTVSIYSFDGLFPVYNILSPTGGGIGYSTYEVEISAEPASTDAIPILIEVTSEAIGYGAVLPNDPVAAYFMYELDVEEGSIVELPDICNGWGDETGNYLHWNNGQTIHDIYTQFNLASDNQGNVWMWSQRTSNALSRCKTAFNGDWGTMWEEDLLPNHLGIWVFWGSVVDVSLTPTFDGGLMAGCSPGANPDTDNELSIAYWNGSTWLDHDDTQWVVHFVHQESEVANRINGYRDSTGRYHAYCEMDGQLVDFYSDGEWQSEFQQHVVTENMPVGQADYACQTRTDFVAESSDGYIYLCWLANGLKVARSQAGTNDWNVIFNDDDTDYDSPTLYVDNEDRVFLAARYYVSNTEDQIRLFKAPDGINFNPDPVIIFAEPDDIIDPCYLVLKGDSVDHLFLSFPYRPGDEGAYAAIVASKPGGDEWTDICVLSNPIIKHPGLAIRPDGSLELCYGYNAFQIISEGSTDNPFSERQLLFGRSHPGFID